MPEGVFTRGGDTKLQEQLGFSPKTPFDGSQCSEFLLEKGPGIASFSSPPLPLLSCRRQRKSAPLPNSAHAASQCRPYRSRSTGMVCRRSPQALRLGMEHASSKKAVWYAESFHRDDQDFNFNSVRDLADFLTARHFSGRCIASARNISSNVGYPIVHIQSVSSSNVRTSFDLLVDAYCSTKIFVNLPGLSRLLVRKITKVMACGTFPLTSSSRSSFGLSQHGAVRASQASRLLRPR